MKIIRNYLRTHNIVIYCLAATSWAKASDKNDAETVTDTALYATSVPRFIVCTDYHRSFLHVITCYCLSIGR